MKKIILHRFGAWGDAIIMTCVFPVLKAQGWHITVNGGKRVLEVLRHNPHVDVFLEHDESIEPGDELNDYIKELGKGYDKSIDLSESIEGSLARVPWRDDFHKSQAERHAECNVNFYDRTLELCGCNEKGKTGELWFSKMEEKLAKQQRKKYKGKFIVLWALSGSSAHKSYPFAEYIMSILLSKYDDIVIFQVGEGLCDVIAKHNHPRAKDYCGVWPIRKSMIWTKYADLVVAPDTGVAHAAGCFDTPQILFLSSNTEEKLSKYFKNCTNLVGDVECHPCHRLHYDLDHCVLDEIIGTPVCMSKLKGKDVLESIESTYFSWREKRHDSSGKSNTG